MTNPEFTIMPSKEEQKFGSNKYTLRFKNKETENDYQEYSYQRLTKHNRLGMFLALLIYPSFLLLDNLLVPEFIKQIAFIRLAIFTPIVIFLITLTYFKFLKKIKDLILSLGIMTATLCVIWIISFLPSPDSNIYFVGLILIFIYGYSFLRISFKYIVLAGFITIVGYEIVVIYINPIPFVLLLADNAYLISANLMGMMGAYTIERLHRRGFKRELQLVEENKKVVKMNEELEQKIKEKTAEFYKREEK